MTQEGFKRKLTAIFSTDAVGYSRLLAEDEAATVKTIASYRSLHIEHYSKPNIGFKNTIFERKSQ